MNLGIPPSVYRSSFFAEQKRAIENADRSNHKRNSDVEIGEARLILTSPNGTRYAVTVANDGTLSTNAI